MKTGYIKLYRQSIDNKWLQHGDLWRFWCYCLLKATYRPYEELVGLQRVPVERGQFIFGRKVAAKELKMSEQTVRTLLAKLIGWQNLTIKSTSKYSIVTIVNWELYQSTDGESTIKSTNSQPASNQQVTTNKKGNKGKKKKTSSASDDSFDVFWVTYPNKKDKKKAIERWDKIKPDDDMAQVIIDGLKAEISWRSIQQGWVADWKLPATWLNGECWTNEHVDTSLESGWSASGITCEVHGTVVPVNGKCPKCG